MFRKNSNKYVTLIALVAFLMASVLTVGVMITPDSAQAYNYFWCGKSDKNLPDSTWIVYLGNSGSGYNTFQHYRHFHDNWTWHDYSNHCPYDTWPTGPEPDGDDS